MTLEEQREQAEERKDFFMDCLIEAVDDVAEEYAWQQWRSWCRRMEAILIVMEVESR